MQCGNCGHELSLSGGECPHCGANTAQQEYFHAPAKKNPPPAKTPPPSKARESLNKPPKAPAKQKKPPVQKKPSPPPTAKSLPVTKPPAPPKKTRKPASPAKPKKEKRSRSKILFVVMLFWAILAVSVYSMYFSIYNDANRYLQAGEDFVQALVMRDDVTLSAFIHPKMHGSLYPLNYGTVESCQTQGNMKEEVNADVLSKELYDHYGIQETVVEAHWVAVEYIVERSGQSASCSIEVLIANIGGDLYVAKTRNILDHAAFP